ncbi:Protein of unknown function DUF4160 [Burkholderiaceae bacterium]|jgi:hypothetical protein
MPTISSFYGILIRMYFNDHEPAHFHVQYAEFKATVHIQSLTVATGELPRRAEELVLDWAELHAMPCFKIGKDAKANWHPKPFRP